MFVVPIGRAGAYVLVASFGHVLYISSLSVLSL